MKTYLRRSGGRIQLVLDDPALSPKERPVLAAMDCYEGTSCWDVSDVRLLEYHVPSRYSASISADDYHSSYQPESAAEASVIKSLLRECREDEDGTLRWCTFNGIVRGQPEINGYGPKRYADFNQAGYLSFADGLAYLNEAKAFWDGYAGDPKDAKIPNPHRQVPLTLVMSEMRMRDLLIAQFESRLAALEGFADAGGLAQVFWSAAQEAIKVCNDDARAVDWMAVNKVVVAEVGRTHVYQADEVKAFLLAYSPGAYTAAQSKAVAYLIDAMVAQDEYAVCPDSGSTEQQLRSDDSLQM